MKQNEKILVYAVTGFLAVILAVAILFGKETPRQVPDVQGDTAQGPSLEEVLNRRAAVTPEVEAAKDPAAKPAGETPAGGGTATPAVGGQPLAANVQLAPPTPAALVTEKIGLSRRDDSMGRPWRVVRAQKGDTLGTLVQKWCGSLDYLEEARGINETLEVLKIGSDVYLPWVEDEVLLAAWEKAHPAPAAIVPVEASMTPRTGAEPTPGLGAGVGTVPGTGSAALDGVPSPSPKSPGSERAAGQPDAAVAATGKKHKVAAGESLWKIAEREVGRKGAAAYIEKILAANPGLDPDRVREGQTLTLPAKN